MPVDESVNRPNFHVTRCAGGRENRQCPWRGQRRQAAAALEFDEKALGFAGGDIDHDDARAIVVGQREVNKAG